MKTRPPAAISAKGQYQTWVARGLLLLLLPGLLYAALNPRFAGWQVVPHGFLYRNGVSYAAVLWFEMHFGEIFHFLMAWLLLLLLPAAELLRPHSFAEQGKRWGALLLVEAPLLEWIQWVSGRGFDLSDIFFHYLGMLAAVFTWWTWRALRPATVS